MNINNCYYKIWGIYMSIIKSFSVGEGDMFYIKHNSSNFSIIDCCLDDDNKEEIVDEIISEFSGKDVLGLFQHILIRII